MCCRAYSPGECIVTDCTITVALTRAQRELILDALQAWRTHDFDYELTTALDYLKQADELEDLLGAVPAE